MAKGRQLKIDMKDWVDEFGYDKGIDSLLKEKFLHEPVLDVRKIGVEYEDGVVILRGQASSYGEMELAKELAFQIPGVEDVKSLLKYEKDVNDESILDGVEVAFSISGMITGENIHFNCHKGIVTLNGTVENSEEKEVAELLAKTVPGVHTVINDLFIKEGGGEDTYH